MKSLTAFWQNFTSSGFDLPHDDAASNRVFFINLFSLIGVLIELGFIVLNMVATNYVAAGIDAVMVLVMVINALLLRRHRNINKAGIVLIVTVAVPLMVLFLISGTQNTNIFWLPVFPVSAYLLLGKKQGSAALSILFLTIGFLTLLESFDLVDLAYSFISIRQMILSLLVLTVLLYVHENLKEQNRQLAEKKRLELSAAYKKVRESEQMRDEFTSSLAHELRNSFVAIQKLTETWRSQFASMSPEKTLQYIDLLHTSASENLSLVTSLLDVMNIDTATFKISKGLYSLREIIDQQVALFEHQAMAKNIALKTEFDDDVPWQLYIDNFRIKQVVANLLSNAIKHTAEHKTIVIHAIGAIDYSDLQEKGTSLRDPWYLSNNEKRLVDLQNFVFLGVSHPEVGISQEDSKKLFKKFSRLEPQDKLHPPTGSGLGLYIIKQIIESHKGVYGFASQTNQGVTFYVTLPIIRDDDVKDIN